ncbi:DUF1772 domain-containing protein [Streptomyces sp. NPDC050636]|uniref:DUF1772 domain-containing protein n=1 Tax=Streptomyces sp. NPDC050636 TaxID=3154510 RepID=UPI00342592B7
MPTTLLVLASIATGLYAGFLVTFLIAIMPALKRLPDRQFTAAMRRINEVVPGPAFGLLFLAAPALTAAALATGRDGRSSGATWLLAAGLAAAVLSHLVTLAGNIPLNSALAKAESDDTADADTADAEARAAFEPRWNQLHRVRTGLSTAAFVLVTVATATATAT